MENKGLELPERRVPLGVVLLIPGLLFLARNEPFLKSFLYRPIIHFPTFVDHFLLTPLLFILCIAVVFAIGSSLLQFLLKEEKCDWPEELIFSVPLGFGCISLSVLIFGLLGFLHPLLFWAMLILAAFLLHKRIIIFFYHIRSAWQTLRENCFYCSLNFFEAFSLGLILWVLLSGIVLSFAPPTDPDTLAYHFYIPFHYIQQGKISYSPEIFYFYLPLNLEMVILFGMLLKGEVLSLLFVWFLNLALLLAILLFGKNHLQNKTIGFLGCAFFACQPVFTTFLGTAKNDSFLALFIFLAIYALYNRRSNDNLRWLSVAGVCAGLAAGTRYTALVFVAVLTAMSLGILIYRKSLRVKHILWFCCPFLIFSAPWYLRNYFWLGNPTWPLFYSFFGGKGLNPELVQAFYLFHHRPEVELGFFGWLTILYRLLTEFRFSAYYNPEYLTWPLLIVLALILFQKKKIPGSILYLALFALFSSYFIFTTDALWRYFLPALPGLTLILAWGCIHLNRGGKGTTTLLILLMLLAVVRLDQKEQLFPVVAVPYPTYPALSPKEGYLKAKLPHYPIIQFIQTELPEKATILLHGHPDRFYVRRKTIVSEPLGQTLIDYQNAVTVDDLLKQLDSLQVSHILFNESGIPAFNDWRKKILPDWYFKAFENLQTILKRHATLLIESENGISLYVLKQKS